MLFLSNRIRFDVLTLSNGSTQLNGEADQATADVTHPRPPFISRLFIPTWRNCLDFLAPNRTSSKSLLEIWSGFVSSLNWTLPPVLRYSDDWRSQSKTSLPLKYARLSQSLVIAVCSPLGALFIRFVVPLFLVRLYPWTSRSPRLSCNLPLFFPSGS